MKNHQTSQKCITPKHANIFIMLLFHYHFVNWLFLAQLSKGDTISQMQTRNI